MIRSFPLVRRTLLLSVCGLFLFSGRLFAGNPLLMPSEAPYGAPRFDRIHAADIMPAIEEGIRAYKAGIAKIRALDPAEATFENVVVPLDRADSLLDVPRAVLGYLKSNFGGDSVIRISLESAQLTGEAYDAVTLDTAIFRLVKAVYDRRDAAGLDSLQLRTLGKVYRSYIRGGALCTPGQKVRLKELNREISLKRIRHGQNITQATQEFVLYVQDSSLLDGLAGTTRQRFARNAARQGHQGVWAVGFTNGDYASVMASATNRDLRRRLYEAYTSRCMDGKYDNRQLSVDIVNLRLERARMLGYENYAAYTLETNMAGTPEKVRELLLPLKDAAAGKGRAERAELEAFAVKYERDSAFRLEPWDVAFYSGKLRKAKFGSELGRMRNYLLFDNVLNDGVFYVANRLFGITLTQRTDIPVFHPDVLTFEAKDAEGRPLGLLYLDCFVRKGKRGGAWCSRLRGYSCAGEREVLPLVTISCNFSRAAEGRPKLLSTSEVKTLFHEFGHALHGMLGEGKYESQTGTNVYRDFVELPSQLMENWATEKEFLDLWAVHYATGEPMPAEIVDRIGAAQNYLAAYANVRQLSFGMTDMAWHTLTEPFEGDVEQFEAVSMAPTQVLPVVSGTAMAPAFGHIFSGGYAAGYYGYKWAEVLEADAFSLFKEKGIFNREAASSFRENVLSKGGTEHPMELYVRFRGHKPETRALIEKMGLGK